MSKTRRILIWLGATVALAGVYLWLFGVSTVVALETRYLGWKNPEMKRTPVELLDSSLSAPSGKMIVFNGYEFEIPWQDVDEEKSKVIKTHKAIAFHSGNAILVGVSAPKEFVNVILKSGLDADSFRAIYGEEPLKSDYAMHRLMLESSPQRITPFSGQKFAIGESMMIIMKAISMPSGADSGLYSVRSNEFKGFQYGDPGKRPKRITIELFADNGSINLVISQKTDGTAPVATQAEINRMIQSVRRCSADSSCAGG